MNDTREMIQRLVDGELNAQDRTGLLLEIDGRSPECWRDLGLGLLEARLISEALRADRDKPSMTTGKARPAMNHRWALAAMLALGLGLGILFPSHGPDPNAGIVGLTDPRPEPKHLQNLEITTNGNPSLSIPILNAADEPREGYKALQAASESMRRVGQAITEKGIRPELSTAYISTDLENGNRLVLPVSYLAIPRDTATENHPEK